MSPGTSRLFAVPAIMLSAALALTSTPASAAPTTDGWAGSGLPQGFAAASSTTGSAAVAAAPAGYPVGIDVSSHDHSGGKTINWSTEAANGVTFAFVKATEGTGYTNPYFNSDYNTAKSVGIFTGAYVFARPDSGNPVGQADYFVDHMQWATDGLTLPPMVDLEWPYFPADSCYGLSPSAMVNWINQFLNRVESRIGRAPAIYTNVNWWNPCTGSSSAFGRYPLDISSCNSSPPSAPGWGSGWTFWQYDIPDCGRGSTRDWDVFNGTYNDLAAFAGGVAKSNPVTGDVGAVAARSGVLALFRKGTDTRVWGASQSGSLTTFGSWISLGTNNFASYPSSLVSTAGTIVNYARGTDGTVYGISQLAPNGAYGSWGPIGSGQPAVQGDPSAQVGPAGHLVVFCTGTDGRVWGVSQVAPGGTYGGWVQVGSSSPTIVSSPATLVASSRVFAVFGRASDNNIYGVSQVAIGGGYGAWGLVGTGTRPQAVGDPSVTSAAAGQIVVYTTASDGSVWGVSQLAAGGAYGSWTRLPSGPAIASSPASFLARSNVLVVVARGADNNIYGINQVAPGGAYGVWTTIGTGSHAPFTGDPSAIVAPNGAIAVYAQGTDGAIWGAAQSAAGSAYGAWTRIGS